MAETERSMALDDSVAGTDEDCATNGVYPTVVGGTFKVDLEFVGMSEVTADETVLTVMYVPFDGDGDQPEFIIVPLGDQDAPGNN